MNSCLLLSSIICGLIICLIIYKKYNIKFNNIYILYIIGIITSIFNHGTSNYYCKYIDRLIITIIIIYLYWLFNNFFIRGLLISAVFYYLISKLNYLSYIKNYLHIFSHIISILILYQIHIINECSK